MKDMARSKAINRWPGKAVLFKRKMDDGRAEAALIAVAGLLRFNDVLPLPTGNPVVATMGSILELAELGRRLKADKA
jgi:hypothetical protein